METVEKIILIVFIVLLLPFIFGLYYVLYYYDIKPIAMDWSIDFKKTVGEEPAIEPIIDNAETPETPEIISAQKLSNPPDIIKAVYVTSSSAMSQKYFEYLDNLFETTQINAVVIDIKNYVGENKVSVFNNLVQKLHDKGIYVIARIAVFEDQTLKKVRPDLAIFDKSKTTDPKNPVLWVDNHNLSWIDPASKDAWDYNISIAKEAASQGFDELNFDYIRFPSDGKIENMGFPFWDKKLSKHLVIKEFFQKLREALPDIKLSADLFGYSTVANDDMGVGQALEDSFDYFDYISPMVYPSHYEDGFIGYSNPAEYPYEVIKYSMQEALKRQTAYYSKSQITTEGATIINKAKFRPWLQDFNMGADYTAEMVKAETKAVADALGEDFYGFMLWNASNIYTTDAIK